MRIPRLVPLILVGIFLFSFLEILAEETVTSDPSNIAVGARILGMGKSYVGLADDLSGIFINPAALSSVSELQLTSMSGKLINEFNYFNAGAALPIRAGVMGIGYVGSSYSFFTPAVEAVIVDGIVIMPTQEAAFYDSHNNVMLLSWGTKIHDKVAIGLTLKGFDFALSGPGIVNGTANGASLDIGLNYRPNPIFRFGLVKNNLGGKIKWAGGGGSEETLASSLKAGVSVKLMSEIRLNLDGDFLPTPSTMPTLLHLGVEWSPLNLLDLRAGIDQDVAGTGAGTGVETVNNLTMGVGIYLGKIRFDYAFHQYNRLSQNDTHYFSITYGVDKAAEAAEYEEGTPAFNLRPGDKSVLYSNRVVVEGETLTNKMTDVVINDARVKVAQGKFRSEVFLAAGKNSIIVRGQDSRGKMLDRRKLRLLRLAPFSDVPDGYWARQQIAYVAAVKAMEGYPDGSFRPDQAMSANDLRAVLGKLGQASALPSNDRPLTRAEAIGLLVRFFNIPTQRVLEPPFMDVPGRYWAVKEITAARVAGLLRYFQDKQLEPDRSFSRADMAEILTRVKPVADKIAELTDWEKGY